MVNVLSLFSGVGGFDIGLENAGMRTIYQCEWDKHATNILNRHWPHVPKWGDITTLTAQEILRHGIPPDVVAWGSPCQDLSVAGKRAGLDGKRSGLFHEGMRLIRELQKETNNEYPRISIWENVAGALSSNNGSDFGVILDEMAEAGAMVIEWSLLDAQHFGIPQRRRRVFVIAIFDPAIAVNCPDPLLPVGESMRRDSSSRKSKGQATSRTLTEGVGGDGQWAAGSAYDGYNQKLDSSGIHRSLRIGRDSSDFVAQPTESTMAVRRLTPLECERLMGWPDDHTRYNPDGSEQADTHRYRQCGNGVASPVAQWIGKHVIKAMEEV